MLVRPSAPPPMNCEPPGKGPKWFDAISSTAPGTVLVVDSDTDAAATIAAALKPSGWHVQTVSTVAEARLQMRAEKPTVVLLDMWQPDVSGVVFVRELASLADIGVVVVSACNDVADRVIGFELGADHYIAKTVSPRELVARVHALHRRIRMQGAESNTVRCLVDCQANG